jgi:hypothetical protein
VAEIKLSIPPRGGGVEFIKYFEGLKEFLGEANTVVNSGRV